MASTRSQTSASIARLKKRLARVPLEVRGAAAAQALIEGNNLVVAMKSSAPKDDGTLRDSIRLEQGRYGDRFIVRAGGPKTTVTVASGGYSVDYALLTEFGSAPHINGGLYAGSNNPGIHAKGGWFFPTYRARRKKIKRNIEQAALAAARNLSD